jgi:hypothetical protein
MLIPIFLSNILSVLVLYFSVKYIRNNCNYTYRKFFEDPIKTISKLDEPFLFKCIEGEYEEEDDLIKITDNSYYEIQEEVIYETEEGL